MTREQSPSVWTEVYRKELQPNAGDEDNKEEDAEIDEDIPEEKPGANTAGSAAAAAAAEAAAYGSTVAASAMDDGNEGREAAKEQMEG